MPHFTRPPLVTSAVLVACLTGSAVFTVLQESTCVFDAIPSLIVTAILVQTPIPPQGASGGNSVKSFGYSSARLWLCHPTLLDVSPHLKPEGRDPPAVGRQQYWYAVLQLVSRLGYRNLERHDFCQRIVPYRIYVLYDLLLLLSVAPINALAGVTNDCLLRVCPLLNM